MSYTLWWIPSGNAYVYFSHIIKHLTQEYGGDVFEPHVTIIANVDLDFDKMVKRSLLLAQSLSPVKLTFSTVEDSDNYWKCIFAPATQTKQALFPGKKAREIFDDVDFMRRPYEPHLSLLYGKRSPKKREAIRTKLTIRQSFIANTLYILSTGEPKDWKILKQIPLKI